MIEERIKKHKQMLIEWYGKHEMYRREAEKLSRVVRRLNIWGGVARVGDETYEEKWRPLKERLYFVQDAAESAQAKVKALTEAIELDYQYLEAGLEYEKTERLKREAAEQKENEEREPQREREREELEERLKNRRKGMRRRLTH